MQSTDLTTIKRSIAIEDVAKRHGIEVKTTGGKSTCRCPFHDDKTPSFSISTVGGESLGHCFGCGWGGDVIKFTQDLYKTDFKGALQYLMPSSSTPAPSKPPKKDPYEGIERIPDATLPDGEFPLYNPGTHKTMRAKPVSKHPYFVGDTCVGYVVRIEIDGKKQHPSIAYVRLPDGTECWSRYPLPEPRPLYDLDGGKSKQIIIVEGEKCADALVRRIGCRVITWSGGTQSVDKSDWSRVRDAKVVIWPDADKPGIKAMHSIAAILSRQGCTIKYVDTEGYTDGWDCADAISEGWSRQQVIDFIKSRVREYIAPEPEMPKTDPQTPDTPTEDPSSPSYNPYDWVHVRSEGLWVNIVTRETCKIGDFNQSFTAFSPVYHDEKDRPKRQKASDYHRLTLDIKSVASIKYDPLSASPIFTTKHDRYLNTYVPPGVVPEPDYVPGSCLVEQHILTIFSAHDAMRLIQHLAYAALNPGKRFHRAVVLQGIEGDGKTTIFNALRGVVGTSNVRIVSNEELSSDFTDFFAGATVIIIEDIRRSGQNRANARDKMKPYITNHLITTIGKGEHGKSNQDNYANFFMATNDVDAIRLDDGDRRFEVYRTIFKDKASARAYLGEEYFTELYRYINSDAGKSRFLSFLQSVDLSDFTPYTDAEMTDAKRDTIDTSVTDDTSDVTDIIATRASGISDKVVLASKVAETAKSTGVVIRKKRVGDVLLKMTPPWHRTRYRVFFDGLQQYAFVRDHTLAEDTDHARRTVRRLLEETTPSAYHSGPHDDDRML